METKRTVAPNLFLKSHLTYPVNKLVASTAQFVSVDDGEP